MKKLLAAILVAALTVVMAVAAVVGIQSATIRIAQIAHPAWRAVATFAEILAGILWLLATVFLSTRLAVLIFRKSSPDPRHGSNPPPLV